jgi:hypothetical protein
VSALVFVGSSIWTRATGGVALLSCRYEVRTPPWVLISGAAYGGGVQRGTREVSGGSGFLCW